MCRGCGCLTALWPAPLTRRHRRLALHRGTSTPVTGSVLTGSKAAREQHARSRPSQRPVYPPPAGGGLAVSVRVGRDRLLAYLLGRTGITNRIHREPQSKKKRAAAGTENMLLVFSGVRCAASRRGLLPKAQHADRRPHLTDPRDEMKAQPCQDLWFLRGRGKAWHRDQRRPLRDMAGRGAGTPLRPLLTAQWGYERR